MKFKYIFFALLIAIAGCRKDESTDGSINVPTGDPTIEVVSGVTGLVTNEFGSPITNATVAIYNRNAKTDENGIFYVNNVGLKRENSTIHIKKEGYFDGFKSFIPDLGKKSFISVQLIVRNQPAKIQSSTGGVVPISGGAELTLPANGIVEKNGGGTYNGEVNVYTHYYDPLDQDIGLTMPGNLLGVLTDESEVQLRTFGMIAVELESSNGLPLQLAAKSKAQLKFPAPSSLEPSSTIPLWYFDEVEGYWTQEGNATLSDGVYNAEVSHFSFWNCDDPFPLVRIEGRLLYEGDPVTNFPVTITLNNGISGFGYTDNEGVFRGKVPKDEELQLKIRNCGVTVVDEAIGPFSNDEILGDINVDLLNSETSIKGRMLNCFDQPAENAYGLLFAGDEMVQVITPLADGTYFATAAGCSNSTYSIQFYDPENVKSTDIIEIESAMSLIDLKDIRICDGLDEFIQYSVDGEFAPLITVADVFIANDEKLIIRGNEEGSFETFDIDVFATTTGNYNPSTVSIRGSLGPNNPELSMMCGDHITNFFTCDQFDVEILSFGEYVTGTFSGILVANKDSINTSNKEFDEFSIEGSFRVKVDQNITTGEISGQFWFDENNSNTREDDEDQNMIVQNVRMISQDGGSVSLFPNFLTAYSQSYKFTNLWPGQYQIWVYKTTGYEVIVKNVGGDNRDNDFESEGGVNFTEFMTVSENEILENVDCGFKLPTSVECGNLYTYGCKPNISVALGIIGGVPPYTVRLNGGPSKVVEDNAVFNVSEGGDYFIDVEDAIGNQCSSEGSVKDYSNAIQGTVWNDLLGGTPNVYDSGEDILLNNIPIILHNENGSVADETVSQLGKYKFQNVSPGVHYISVNVPNGATIVELNTNVAFGNDIDPATGRSGDFTVGDCNSYFTFDVGLK